MTNCQLLYCFIIPLVIRHNRFVFFISLFLKFFTQYILNMLLSLHQLFPDFLHFTISLQKRNIQINSKTKKSQLVTFAIHILDKNGPHSGIQGSWPQPSESGWCQRVWVRNGGGCVSVRSSQNLLTSVGKCQEQTRMLEILTVTESKFLKF